MNGNTVAHWYVICFLPWRSWVRISVHATIYIDGMRDKGIVPVQITLISGGYIEPEHKSVHEPLTGSGCGALYKDHGSPWIRLLDGYGMFSIVYLDQLMGARHTHTYLITTKHF